METEMDNLNIATQFDGTFDLTFLELNEKVRSAGPGTNAVEVITPTKTIRVEKGDWLIRTPSGNLIARNDLS